jgi:hypothetical protein
MQKAVSQHQKKHSFSFCIHAQSQSIMPSSQRTQQNAKPEAKPEARYKYMGTYLQILLINADWLTSSTFSHFA